MKPARASDVSTLDGILHALYEVLSGPAGQPRDWERYRSLFIEGARLIVVVAAAGEKPHARQLTVEDYIRRVEPMSFTGIGPGPGDSLLATPTTPMPAARVRLLQLDSTTRASLAITTAPLHYSPTRRGLLVERQGERETDDRRDLADFGQKRLVNLLGPGLC